MLHASGLHVYKRLSLIAHGTHSILAICSWSQSRAPRALSSSEEGHTFFCSWGSYSYPYSKAVLELLLQGESVGLPGIPNACTQHATV